MQHNLQDFKKQRETDLDYVVLCGQRNWNHHSAMTFNNSPWSKTAYNENCTTRDSQADNYVYVVSAFVLVKMACLTCTCLSVSWITLKQWTMKSVFTSSKQPFANTYIILVQIMKIH